MGTLRMFEKIPFSPKTFQKGLDFRNNLNSGLPKGIFHFQKVKIFFGGLIEHDERFGKWVRLSRVRKSKIACAPGLTPVWKVDHATGDMEGQVVARAL